MGSVYSVKCDEYKIEKVEDSINKIFEYCGGIESIVNKGDKVFLKLNLIARKNPDCAATTHPFVVQAVAKAFVDYGCSVVIGDSPGGPYNEKILKGLYKTCGIEEAAKNAGASLNYDCSFIEKETPKNCTVRRLTLINPPLQCDKIITISKLKTHSMALYTGAVKVLFGMIPGMIKAEYHFKMPDIKDFTNLLVDICETVKPTFSIIDGIVGMEGDGPTAGTPVKTGVILASENPYELDMIGAKIIGLKVDEVETIKRAIERNLCVNDVSQIQVIGADVNGLIKKYKTPNLKSINFFKGKVPINLENFLSLYLAPKPIFNYKICVGCGFCKENCPAKAIVINNKKPIVDYKKCIRCFCCQELCPNKAVEIKRSWLLKKILG